MTQTELIERARRGKLVVNLHSLHRPGVSGKWVPRHLCPHDGGWRTIVCDNEHDVVECSRCGAQRIAACNFDEEYD